MQVGTHVVAAEPNSKLKNYIGIFFFFFVKSKHLTLQFVLIMWILTLTFSTHCTYSVNVKLKIILLPQQKNQTMQIVTSI